MYWLSKSMKYVLWVVAVPASCRLDRRCLQVKRMKLLQLFTKETFVGQSGIGTNFSPCTSVFPCQYHSTIAPYSFIHLPPTLYNVFLPVLQFSPVSIIPPLLHTHSFIYHPRCRTSFSQNFSFPPSVSYHQCSIFINLPPTLFSPSDSVSPVSIIPLLLLTHSSTIHAV